LPIESTISLTNTESDFMAKAAQEKDTGASTLPPKDMIAIALMRLAGSEPWDLITLPMIAKEAGLSLAHLRDHYPSKGAILGGFARMIDRVVLSMPMEDMAGEAPRDRLLDVMMKRLDALEPYKDGIRSLKKAMRRDPLLAVALNPTAINSFRFMLAAADIETEDGLAPVRIQGAVVLFSRAIDVWLDDEDTGLSKTMAFLDKELERGIGIMRRFEDLDRMAAPFRGFMRAMGDRRRDRGSFRDRMKDRFDEMRDRFDGRRNRREEGDGEAA
jgi:AcrR family transcriptional regulator